MVVLGGATSLTGALAGAVFLRCAEYYLSGSTQLLVTGAGVLLVLLVLPGGLARILNAARLRWFRLVARLRHIDLSAAAGGTGEVDLGSVGDRLGAAGPDPLAESPVAATEPARPAREATA
jgi:branched-chain amino acid transport system permease protein